MFVENNGRIATMSVNPSGSNVAEKDETTPLAASLISANQSSETAPRPSVKKNKKNVSEKKIKKQKDIGALQTSDAQKCVEKLLYGNRKTEPEFEPAYKKCTAKLSKDEQQYLYNLIGKTELDHSEKKCVDNFLKSIKEQAITEKMLTAEVRTYFQNLYIEYNKMEDTEQNRAEFKKAYSTYISKESYSGLQPLLENYDKSVNENALLTFFENIKKRIETNKKDDSLIKDINNLACKSPIYNKEIEEKFAQIIIVSNQNKVLKELCQLALSNEDISEDLLYKLRAANSCLKDDEKINSLLNKIKVARSAEKKSNDELNEILKKGENTAENNKKIENYIIKKYSYLENMNCIPNIIDLIRQPDINNDNNTYFTDKVNEAVAGVMAFNSVKKLFQNEVVFTSNIERPKEGSGSQVDFEIKFKLSEAAIERISVQSGITKEELKEREFILALDPFVIKTKNGLCSAETFKKHTENEKATSVGNSICIGVGFPELDQLDISNEELKTFPRLSNEKNINLFLLKRNGNIEKVKLQSDIILNIVNSTLEKEKNI